MQISKKGKRILMLVLVWAFFTGGVIACKYFFTPSSITLLVNYNVKNIEKNHENIDMVFVGGSRTYRSFDPDIFEETLGIHNAINNGSPNQRTKLSYYLLKDVLEKHQPKVVVIGSTYNGLMYGQETYYYALSLGRMSIKNRFISSFDHYGFNKGLQSLTGKEWYLENMLPSKVIKTVKRKRLQVKGIDKSEDSIQKLNGYKGTYEPLEQGSVSYRLDGLDYKFSEEDIIPEQQEYFDKMVKMCKDRGIEVILLSGPCTLMNLYYVEDYQKATEFYQEYAKENNIKYYNLNYVKNREKVLPDNRFIDRLHVNYDGGQVISKLAAKVIKEVLEGKDPSHYFYNNLEELKKDVHRIPACGCLVTPQGTNLVISADSVHNDNVVPKYRLLVSSDDPMAETKTFKAITKWSTKNKWIIPVKDLETCTYIRLQAKSGEAGEIIAFATKNLSKYIKNEK